MAQPLPFIAGNPARDRFQQDFDRRQETRQREETDSAIRSGLAERDNLTPVARNLTQVPGGGQAAFQAQSQSDEQADEQERLALQALGRGDMDVFDFYARRTGLQIPEDIVRNARLRSLFSQGALVAERVYGSHRQYAPHRLGFVTAYMQSGGNPMTAYEIGGPAPATGGSGGHTPATVRSVDAEVGQWLMRGNVPYTTNAPTGSGYWQDPQGNISIRSFEGIEYNDQGHAIAAPQQPASTASQPGNAPGFVFSTPQERTPLNIIGGATTPQTSPRSSTGDPFAGQYEPATGLPMFMDQQTGEVYVEEPAGQPSGYTPPPVTNAPVY